MVAEGDKKIKVDQQEASDHIDAALVLSIEKLQEVQDELEKVNEEASDRVLEIEQKYNEIRRPVYLRRSEIIASIPDFWLTAFLSHPALCDLFSEEDQKIFKYLDSLNVEDSKDVKSGYSITFNFKQNPYFEDIKLTKVLTFLDDESTKITGTNIKWKEGMNPTDVQNTTNEVDHDKTGNKRPFSDVSFFTWFGETAVNEKSSDVFQDEVAELIKEDLWPNPLRYFSNVDEDDEDDSDDSDVGVEELDDDEDDEENGNEEEDS